MLAEVEEEVMVLEAIYADVKREDNRLSASRTRCSTCMQPADPA
jgi:hypothetical protein